ncbi:PadR family transcriptional regulator [Chloroflexota bacterium]
MHSDTLNKKFIKELLAGATSLMLLSTLARSQEAMYGYQIAKLLAPDDDQAPLIKQGALYPVLRQLENKELLASTVEPSVSGPPRRYYTITDTGRRTLEEWIAIWTQFKNMTDKVLEGNNHDS